MYGTQRLSGGIMASFAFLRTACAPGGSVLTVSLSARAATTSAMGLRSVTPPAASSCTLKLLRRLLNASGGWVMSHPRTFDSNIVDCKTFKGWKDIPDEVLEEDLALWKRLGEHEGTGFLRSVFIRGGLFETQSYQVAAEAQRGLVPLDDIDFSSTGNGDELCAVPQQVSYKLFGRSI